MQLSVSFGAFTVFPSRNRPPFTLVHSHAAAQKLSGAFFRVWAGERCRKRPSGRRNALRGSQGVRPRTLMLNAAVWRVLTSHIMLSLRLSPEKKPSGRSRVVFYWFFCSPRSNRRSTSDSYLYISCGFMLSSSVFDAKKIVITR